MSTGPSLYNPRDTQPEQLDALLTGRKVLLDEILSNLREQAHGATRQHWLLRGQRGMGKTHLAGVIHYRVKTDATLNQAYLPLWLGEADTYEVYSAATLLKTIGERLAEETKDAELLTRLDKLEGVGDEEGYFQEMAEVLTAAAVQHGRVLLVLMENLDALLGSFGPKERKEQTRQLRSLLLHNRHILFISTTPTYYLNNPLDDPKEPLYAHLKERDLDHLTEPEAEQLLRKLAQLYPREGADSFLDGRDGRLRLRVIHRLTGGLPRSIVMAFTAIREASGIGSLVQELRALLDAQTAYFEARLSQSPARERAIVTTLALAPTNLTMKEIATRSRLPERTLSTLIGRLEKEGHVRPVTGSGGKGAVYELSEGLFRLWYQYRKGRQVLEPLVEFLAYWYRVEELEYVVTSLRQGTGANGATRAADLALLQAEEALRRASSLEGQQERERFWAECQQALLAETATVIIDAWAKLTAAELLEAAVMLKNPDQEEGGRQRIQQLLREGPLAEEQTRPRLVSLLVKAIAQQFSPNKADEFSLLLSLVVEHFEDEQDSTVHEAVAQARFMLAALNMDKEPRRAIHETERVLTSTFADTSIKLNALFVRGSAFDALGDSDAAVPLLEEFVAAPSSRDAQPGVSSLVLRAMTTLVKFHIAKRQEKQIRAISEEIIARFGSLQEEPFRSEVACARWRVALLAPGAIRIKAMEEWLTRYGDLADPIYRQMRIALITSLVLAKSAQGDSSAYKTLDALVDMLASEVRFEEVQLFLYSAADLFVLFGVERMVGWLTRLKEAPGSEQARLLAWLFLMAAELLAADDPANGNSSATASRNAWARIPPELRQHLEDFVKQVRARQSSAR
jgi:hypothetical protein